MTELLIQNQNFNIWNPMAELTPMMTSGFSMGATFDLGPARPFSCRLDLLPPFIITPGNNILLPRLDLPWLSLDCDPSWEPSRERDPIRDPAFDPTWKRKACYEREIHILNLLQNNFTYGKYWIYILIM